MGTHNEMDSPAVVAYKRCVALLSSIRTRDALPGYTSEEFDDIPGVFDSDEHEDRAPALDLANIKRYVAFKVALHGLDLDVDVDGEHFIFWAQQQEFGEVMPVIVGEAKNLFARRKSDGRTVAHHFLGYEVGRHRIASMDVKEARAVLTLRTNDLATPMHYSRFDATTYRTIRGFGRDLLSMFGSRNWHNDTNRRMVIEHYRRPMCLMHNDDVLRCKVFVFALQRFCVRAPFLVKDGDNAILNRIGAFVFAPKPQYV